MTLHVAIPVLAVFCLADDLSARAQHAAKTAAPRPAAAANRSDRTATAKVDRQIQKQERRAGSGPGSAEHLAKLLTLSPDQRKKALGSLPPDRRTQIEKRLNDYQNMPEPERAKALDRLRRMQSLPPQKQVQVRASVRHLTELAPPRHALVQRQINQLKPLSDDDRSALVNSEEFRSKFTPAEQQIIADIALVTPRN